MKESDLYIPVRDWLQKRGYTVYVEIFNADIIARKDGRLVVVELKCGLTDHLLTQMVDRAMWADEVWGAVGVDCTNRDLSRIRYYGMGLLSVVAGKVRQHVRAKPQPWKWHRMRAYRVKVLDRTAPALPHHLAGLPSCPQAASQRREPKETPCQETP